jgi:hypothetical protein
VYFNYEGKGPYTIYNVNDDDTYDIMDNNNKTTIIYNVKLEELTIQERVEFNTTNMDSENCSDTIPNVPILDGDILEKKIVEGDILEEEEDDWFDIIVAQQQREGKKSHTQKSNNSRYKRINNYKFPGGSRRKTKRNSKKRRRTQRRK